MSLNLLLKYKFQAIQTNAIEHRKNSLDEEYCISRSADDSNIEEESDNRVDLPNKITNQL